VEVVRDTAALVALVALVAVAMDLTLAELLPLELPIVAAVEAVVMLERLAALESLLFVIRVVSVGLAAQSHLLAVTPITHLLLQGHIQHEPLCKSL
jgi:hypothetical protein